MSLARGGQDRELIAGASIEYTGTTNHPVGYLQPVYGDIEVVGKYEVLTIYNTGCQLSTFCWQHSQ